MAHPQSPIVVLDSGLGGLTVVAALRKELPAEDVVYFGDTARVPYGCKSPDTVTGFVRDIVSYLQPLRPKHVVIACNTATAAALPVIKAEFRHLSISGVIDPGARAAVVAAGSKPVPVIAVIATDATVKSKAYDRAIYRRRHYCHLIVKPTPLLASIIEDGRDENDTLVRVALTQYLKPLLEHKPDVLILGCTHYPVYKKLIARMMGDGCRVIDSAGQCAQDVAQRLRANHLLATGRVTGSLRCFVTDDPFKFRALSGRFLGSTVESPTLVSLEQLSAGMPLAVAA